MHLFHKWSIVDRKKGNYKISKGSCTAILIIEQCLVCNKKRAYFKTLSGKKYKADIDFVEEFFNIDNISEKKEDQDALHNLQKEA